MRKKSDKSSGKMAAKKKPEKKKPEKKAPKKNKKAHSEYLLLPLIFEIKPRKK